MTPGHIEAGAVALVARTISLMVLAAGGTWLLVSYVRHWATRRRIIDVPNERSSHTRPTPRGGGVGVVAFTIAGLALSAWVGRVAPGDVFALCSAGLVVAVIGFRDDVRPLPQHVRLAVHVLAAIAIAVRFGPWLLPQLPALGVISLGLGIGTITTVLWIVGLTNAYNFMDGIDGIAGAQAVVAGFGWFCMGVLLHAPMLALAGGLLAATSGGFLLHNWPPARIFMGDVGSVFLGFVFAALAVIGTHTDARLAFAGVLFVAPFAFDSIFTFVRRLIGRENVFAAHRSHLYQRLVIAGSTHRFVTLLYAGIAGMSSMLAVAWVAGLAWAEWAIVPFLAASCAALWLLVVRQERVRRMIPWRSKVGEGNVTNDHLLEPLRSKGES